MKKTIGALAALILLTLLCAAGLAEENLIVNGDFSRMDGENPAGWRREMWLSDSGISLMGIDEDSFDGQGVYVTNVDANDARFAQTVAVKPNTLYRVSGMVRAEGCDPGGYGATISIGDVFVYSESCYDTLGQWQYVELYGRTGDDQTALDVFCRVGGYSNLSRGKGQFDDIEVVEVDKAPADAPVYDFFREETASFSNADTSDTSDDMPERFTEAWLLFTCV